MNATSIFNNVSEDAKESVIKACKEYIKKNGTSSAFNGVFMVMMISLIMLL